MTCFDLKQLTRYDAQTGSELARLALPAGSAAVIFDFDAVWVTGSINNELYRIDPATNLIVDTIPLLFQPAFSDIWERLRLGPQSRRRYRSATRRQDREARRYHPPKRKLLAPAVT